MQFSKLRIRSWRLLVIVVGVVGLHVVVVVVVGLGLEVPGFLVVLVVEVVAIVLGFLPVGRVVLPVGRVLEAGVIV